MKKAKLMIYFLNEQSLFEITYAQKHLIRRAIKSTLEYEGYKNNAEISLTFTDNEKIRRINSEFRKIDKPTDVLSFPLTDYENTPSSLADEPSGSLGDIVISLERAKELRDYFVRNVSALENVRVNSPANALPYITNISVLGIPSEVMLNFLSDMGIYVSSGSACSKGHKSRVLAAMNLSDDRIGSALRISISRFTTKEEIDYLLYGIANAQKTMRKMK